MTNLAIDHLIAGNGYGMASPGLDMRFYWLVDSETWRGDLYTFGHGLGAQLHSWQWTHPNAGERRVLCSRKFKPFHSTRRWGRVAVAWSWVDLPNGIDEANASLRELAKEIGRGW